MKKILLMVLLCSSVAYARGGGGHGGGHSSGGHSSGHSSHAFGHSSSHASSEIVTRPFAFSFPRMRSSSSGPNQPSSNTQPCVDNPKWYQFTAKKCSANNTLQ